jgi:integrase
MKGDGKLHLIQWPPVPGLYYQITPSGYQSWVVRGTLHGKQVLRTLGPFAGYKLAQVEEDGRKALALIKSGIDPSAVQAPEPVKPPLRLKTLWADYDRIEGPKKSAPYRKKQGQDYFRCLDPVWGELDVTTIDSGMANRLLDTYTPSVSNKLMDMISSMWALGKLYYPQENLSNPTAGRKRYKMKKGERFITNAEAPLLGKAWKESKSEHKFILLWLLLTGSRCGVCTEYKPEWLVGPDRMIFPEDEPGLKKARFVVIPTAAQPLVAKFIPTQEKRLCKLCHTLAKQAGIPAFTPHDLRRSFGTFGVDLGEPDDQIESLLNHTRCKVTEAYLKRNIDPLIPVAERISAHIISLLGLDPGKLV